MKKLILTAILTGASLAAAPSYSIDGFNALPDVGLGKEVYAVPGSTWEVHFEDQPNWGDWDFNDFGARIHFSSILPQGYVLGAVVFLGENSAHTHQMVFPGYVSLKASMGGTGFISPVDALVDIRLDDFNTNTAWYTGLGRDGERQNADYLPHAIVSRIYGVPTPTGGTETPEPGTTGLLLGGLAGLLVMGLKRKARP